MLDIKYLMLLVHTATVYMYMYQCNRSSRRHTEQGGVLNYFKGNYVLIFTSRIAIRCPLFTTNTLINPLHTPSIVLCNSMDIISWHGRQVSTLEVKTSPRPYSRVSSTRRSRSATPSSVTFQCRHIYGNDFCLVYTAELEVMDRVARTEL